MTGPALQDRAAPIQCDVAAARALRRPVRTRWLAVGVAALATSCAVGPDFKTPPSPAVSGYTPGPRPAETTSAAVPGGEAQRFGLGADISAQWWTLFHSPALNTLVE